MVVLTVLPISLSAWGEVVACTGDAKNIKQAAMAKGFERFLGGIGVAESVMWPW